MQTDRDPDALPLQPQSICTKPAGWKSAITPIFAIGQETEWLGLTIYLALGWFGVFGGALLARRYGLAFIKPLVIGGLLYSLGAILHFRGWFVVIPGWIHAHELCHIAVLLAALIPWRFIWQIACGKPRVALSADR